MNAQERKDLQVTAAQARLGIIEGVFHAKSGHPGGSLSAAEIFTYLYWKELQIDPQNPKDPNRDRFVLSKGHCAPGLYAVLALRGYFDVSELQKLRHIGAMLQGHPDMKGTPGVDMSSGSLGQGISAAVGMALAGKLDQKDYRVYTLLGDGECEEGQVWEAAMFAGHHKLDNLCVIVDYNGLQIDGPVQEVVGPAPFEPKFQAFGFETITVEDGNDFDQLEQAFAAAKACKGKPCAIIAHTVKGKGVSFMENQVGWHGKAPNAEEYEVAMKELKENLEVLQNG
ncbi:MAG TPA: transketolase [Candidatus Acutalibacter pullicola]|uniref:Transketolase n=1 Tax=Candidatus Acutalibacter pullicola TaxID=2838417 RepID=A0A9D2MVH0_9FIRM|nr:transketolase [Candidatus Acutalibacter pullicola]